MSSQVSSWTLMGDFLVQECCVHGTDLESHGPTSILCNDPLPLLTTIYPPAVQPGHAWQAPVTLGPLWTVSPRAAAVAPGTLHAGGADGPNLGI